MRNEVPKFLIVGAVVIVVVLVGFLFVKGTQAPAPEVETVDASKMSMEDIQRSKEEDHARDAQRGRQ